MCLSKLQDEHRMMLVCTRHHDGEQKNCAISHPLLNEGSFIREYSKSHWNDL